MLKIDPKDIVDTNGAGDAFVGGKSFLLSAFDRFYGLHCVSPLIPATFVEIFFPL